MRLFFLCLALMQSTGSQEGAFPLDTGGNASSGDTVTLRMRLNDKGERAPVAYRSPRGNILFSAIINDRPVTMLLDNGAERTLIDTRFARQAGIGTRPSNRNAIASSGTLIGTATTDAVTLVVPGTFRVAGPMVSTDLSPIATALGQPVDAVLGSDVLNEFAVFIDPGNKRLMFYPGGSVSSTGGTAALPIADGAIVAAELNGHKVRLKIDLGFTGIVRLSDAAWQRVVPAGSATRKGAQTSIDGIARMTQIADAALHVGPVRIDRVPVDSGYRPAGSADGLLGNGFLSRGLVILDLKGRKLLLLPRQPSPIGSARTP